MTLPEEVNGRRISFLVDIDLYFLLCILVRDNCCVRLRPAILLTLYCLLILRLFLEGLMSELADREEHVRQSSYQVRCNLYNFLGTRH
jgi:hypothetical protein